MYYTNDRILIESAGDNELLEEAVDKLHEFLSGQYPSIYFEIVERPFTHALVPDYIKYEDMKSVLGADLKRRAINDDTLDLSEEVVKEVKYYFTPEELERKADDLVQQIKRRDELETEKKAVVHAMNEQLKEIEVRISTLAQNRREKYEVRKVTCTKQLNFTDNKVYFMAGDEIQAFEEMTASDRQLQISFDSTGVPMAAREEGGEPGEPSSLDKLKVNLDELDTEKEIAEGTARTLAMSIGNMVEGDLTEEQKKN